MSSPIVADILHLAHGVTPAERDQVVASLARLDDRFSSYPDGSVKLQLSVKERDTPSQRTTLEAWIPDRPPIVATSERTDFDAAIIEVRDELIRQVTDAKHRTEPRKNRALREHL